MKTQEDKETTPNPYPINCRIMMHNGREITLTMTRECKEKMMRCIDNEGEYLHLTADSRTLIVKRVDISAVDLNDTELHINEEI